MLSNTVSVQPKYKIGKIKSKYIILDMLSMAMLKLQGFSFIYGVNQMTRKMIIENYLIAKRIFTDGEVLRISFLHID